MHSYTAAGRPTYASVLTERTAAITPVGQSIATVSSSLENGAAAELAFSQEQNEIVRVLHLLNRSWPICQYDDLIMLNVNDSSAAVQLVLQEIVGSCEAQMLFANGWGVTAAHRFHIPDQIQVGFGH